MKKSLYVICITIILLVLNTVFFIILYNKDKNTNVLLPECVATESHAISIAKIVSDSVFPELDVSGYVWECFYNEKKNDLYEENTWIVYCSDGDPYTLGGGLPEIHIKKDNAQIVSCALSK